MSKKDVIIRVSGTNELAEEFLIQVKEELETYGLLSDIQTIRAVPDKVRKSDIINAKAKDMKVSVIGDETTVDEFLEAVISIISEEMNLPEPSLNLMLESDDDGS